MTSKKYLVISIVLAALATLAVASVQARPNRAPQAPLGSGFTYQGELASNGTPMTADCTMAFRLYGQADGGAQVASPITTTVPVSNGLFTVNLDFGAHVFAGDARWLGIRVQCPGDSAATDLGRQALTAAPYSWYAHSTGALQGYAITTTTPLAGQVLKWDGAYWVPATDQTGAGSASSITTVNAGAGLNGGGTGDAVTLTVAFGGSGSASTVAHSDHDHAGTYASTGHTHPGSAITSAVPTATLALSATQISWSNILGIPAPFADGVDDVSTVIRGTQIFAGDGLTQVVNGDSVTMSVSFAGSGGDYGTATTVARADHTHRGSDITSAVPTATIALSVDWSGLTGIPADLADGDDGTAYTAGTGLMITGTEMSVDFSAVASTTHKHLYFQQDTRIPTNGAADWEFFTIDSNPYLIVANYKNESTQNIDSKLYRWHGTYFTETQSIPTVGAYDWEFFTIDNEHYLAVANYYNGSSFNLNSKIYHWNGTSFVEFQSFSTQGAMDWEFFTIGSEVYLAVANSRGGLFNYNANSKIYRWNGASFTEFQSILTTGAADLEFFTIGSDAYLAIAHCYNGSTYDLDSKIYHWNGANFAETQSIPTNGAFDWEFFTIDSDAYLAVANSRDGTLNYNVNSKIYRWNGASFIEFQAISTMGAYDWEFFTISNDIHLAVANNFDGSTVNVDSKIYRWNGMTFVENQSIPTNGAFDWEFFTVDSNDYLAVANYRNDATRNIDSKIYKLQSCCETGGLWEKNTPHTCYNTGNVGIGTTTPATSLDVAGGAIRTDDQLISTVPTGTAPLSVTSSTQVENFNADMVDGQHASDFAPASHIHSGSVYSNVIIVAKSGGDFMSIQSALDSITDASAHNSYLIWVAPGVYTETVTMKAYVDIEGAGELATKITASGSSANDTGTVVGADNAELRFLTVENTGGNTHANGIYNDGASPRLTHLTVVALQGNSYTRGVYNGAASNPTMTDMRITSSSSSDQSYAVNNENSSPTMKDLTLNAISTSSSPPAAANGIRNSYASPTILDTTITVSGGYGAAGILNSYSSARITNVNIVMSGASYVSYGIHNDHAGSPVMNTVSISITGGSTSGVLNQDGATPTMSNMTILADGGSNQGRGIHNTSAFATIYNSTITVVGSATTYGIYNVGTSGAYTVTVHNSQISANTNTIYNASAFTTRVGASWLSGGTVGVGGGTVTCAGVYDEAYAFYASSCP